MATKTWKKLFCGYTINVFDSPYDVKSIDGRFSIRMRLTHSAIRFMFTLDGSGVAFSDKINPINIKESPERDNAIEEAIIEWYTKNSKIVEGSYRMNVKTPCNGSCKSKICFQKEHTPRAIA